MNFFEGLFGQKEENSEKIEISDDKLTSEIAIGFTRILATSLMKYGEENLRLIPHIICKIVVSYLVTCAHKQEYRRSNMEALFICIREGFETSNAQMMNDGAYDDEEKQGHL